ncbi:MAG: twin-arginine translocase subunit TatC [Fibrobacteria bacterium]|nr:twin-arginine translocase subunit TatC [Fibrobacteria bacterium]
MKSLPDNNEMTLWDHIRELRSRLIYASLAIVIASIGSYIYWRKIWALLTQPLKNTDVQLINTAPIEAFITSIKVAIISGIVISSPIVLWHIWRFIAPGLFEKEKKMIIPVLFFSVALFLGGAAFCYFTVLPYGIAFLANYTLGDITPSWRQGEYASFILKVLIAFGASFELPIISFALTRLGLVDAKMLWSFSRYAIIIIFVTAAFLTPPDPVTQVLLAVPLILIYGLSIFISYLTGKKNITS